MIKVLSPSVGLLKYRIILVANSLQMDHFHENISFLEKFREITSQQHLCLFTSARAIFEFVVILRQTKPSRSVQCHYKIHYEESIIVLLKKNQEKPMFDYTTKYLDVKMNWQKNI